MNIATEESLQTLIHPLGLAVGLRVVARAEAQRDVCEFEQLLPKTVCEHFVAVRDDGVWKAMESIDCIKEQTSHTLGSEWVRKTNEVTILGEPIDHNQARVQMQKPKFQKKIPAPAWRLKSRRNKKRIATAVCKWRDESNEPNQAIIRC